LSLEDAAERLAAGRLPPNAIVITIDDGFFSVRRLAWPELAKHPFPFTVYVTSYYAGKQQPIFRLAIQYMFWKTRVAELDTTSLMLPLPSRARIADEGDREQVQWAIIRHGEIALTEPQRNQLAKRLGERLAVDYSAIEANRAFTLMTSDDITELD